jgi:hypothetical protein
MIPLVFTDIHRKLMFKILCDMFKRTNGPMAHRHLRFTNNFV